VAVQRRTGAMPRSSLAASSRQGKRSPEPAASASSASAAARSEATLPESNTHSAASYAARSPLGPPAARRCAAAASASRRISVAGSPARAGIFNHHHQRCA
jgi:hypothetical protein